MSGSSARHAEPEPGAGGQQSADRLQLLERFVAIGFEYPHPIGSICGKECPHCNPGGGQGVTFIDCHGDSVPVIPVAIIAEATERDWQECRRRSGMDPDVRAPHDIQYFYFVSMD
jgi:hypothetical protein